MLTSTSFAVIYPWCFFMEIKDPLKNNFHHFHIGLPAIVSSMVTIYLFLSSYPDSIKMSALWWTVLLMATAACSWKKENVNLNLIFISSAIGLWAYNKIFSHTVHMTGEPFMISILAAAIFCAALYAMNLGHWYLNVHGLPIQYLRKATLIFVLLLLARLIWDAYLIIEGHVFYGGEDIKLLSFLFKADGFFLILAIFFGTLFPLISSRFVLETIRHKNTQSATGMLYVVLCGVIMGDLIYKYYMIKYGVGL